MSQFNAIGIGLMLVVFSVWGCGAIFYFSIASQLDRIRTQILNEIRDINLKNKEGK